MKRVLIVDDEENIGRSLRLILEREGYSVGTCVNAAEARAISQRPDLYMIDVRLPDANGIELVRSLRSQDISAPIVMISGHGTIAEAVEATRAGAFDFLEKPLSRDKVLLSIKHALAESELREENQRLKEIAGNGSRMIGASPAFQKVLEQATMAARTDARVLLTGESGTGKELLAAHIHASSPFSNGPFVKVNCAAIPMELIESELFGHEKGAFTGAASARRGKFELAHGGTLFLDECGDLHASSQAKLLRVLQEGEFHRVGGEQAIQVSVRVLAATNRDLREMVAQAKFREDLYYRLCVMPVRVPALRERPEDIRPLAEYFLAEFCARNNFRPKTFASDAIEALQDYSWPGNIRELRNVVERMAILAGKDLIEAESVPAEVRFPKNHIQRGNLRATRESAEREHILRALKESEWNVSSAARTLGMERTNLHKRIRALGIEREK
ncbi:MAG: sigma-54-dependent Fis family transcriptional regulator [Bryobacterales bacterium]|nr:sigma-54-dependent Fis family transcriptional regulator [Bryobacterales bacterium]MBV9397293.1 sigma-54-dependent Fis family transcriptional regulator [Bryobacterales bacterium]